MFQFGYGQEPKCHISQERQTHSKMGTLRPEKNRVATSFKYKKACHLVSKNCTDTLCKSSSFFPFHSLGKYVFETKISIFRYYGS